jgi:hypothetical protein
MPKKRKPAKFLNLKLLEKFLRDYKKMPYKSKSAIMAAVLIVMLIPIALIYPLDDPRQPVPLDLAPLDIAPQTSECFITGCSNHLCLDAEIDAPFTTCDYRPEFACLEKAKCERQPKSGRCGWTDTPEYLQCLSQIKP